MFFPYFMCKQLQYEKNEYILPAYNALILNKFYDWNKKPRHFEEIEYMYNNENIVSFLI